MEMFCPDCMGPLSPVTEATAKCTLHGGVYRMLFVRSQAPLVDAPGPGNDAPVGTRCAHHPEVVARFSCSRCRSPLCANCVFPQPDGTMRCPGCATGSVLGLSTPLKSAVAAGVTCPRHPGVPAVERCANCGTPTCPTCDFAFPGDLHFCPQCATSPGATLSDKRKRSALWSLALAGWSTVAFVGFLIVASFTQSKEGQDALGVALTITVLIPSVIGVAMGLGALERRQANPFWVWAAALWNGLLLGGFILLSIIGTLMG